MSRTTVRMAGSDPATVAMALGILGAGAGTTGMGLVDLFTGDTNGANSGEIPSNLVLSMLPGLGLGIGAEAAQAFNPQAALFAQENRARLLARRAQGASPGGDVAVTPEMAQLLQKRFDAASRLQEGDVDLSREAALQQVRTRGRRALYAGGLVGTLAGAIPAVMAMRDQPIERGAL